MKSLYDFIIKSGIDVNVCLETSMVRISEIFGRLFADNGNQLARIFAEAKDAEDFVRLSNAGQVSSTGSSSAGCLKHLVVHSWVDTEY